MRHECDADPLIWVYVSVCMCAGGLSEGLIVASGVVVVVMWVGEVVGLVAVVAVTDDRMLNAFALQLVLLLNPVQPLHQFLDEGLQRSTAATE